MPEDDSRRKFLENVGKILVPGATASLAGCGSLNNNGSEEDESGETPEVNTVGELQQYKGNSSYPTANGYNPDWVDNISLDAEYNQDADTTGTINLLTEDVEIGSIQIYECGGESVRSIDEEGYIDPDTIMSSFFVWEDGNYGIAIHDEPNAGGFNHAYGEVKFEDGEASIEEQISGDFRPTCESDIDYP